jgi:hypothetical protein
MLQWRSGFTAISLSSCNGFSFSHCEPNQQTDAKNDEREHKDVDRRPAERIEKRSGGEGRCRNESKDQEIIDRLNKIALFRAVGVSQHCRRADETEVPAKAEED